MNIYCRKHRTNHRFTNTQVERLIYGIQADLADTEAYCDGGQTGEDADPTKILDQMCLIQQVDDYRDPEMYQEYIESTVSTRKVIEHEFNLRREGHDVVLG